MKLSFFYNGVKREWQRILDQPSYWASLLVLPPVAFLLIIAIIASPTVSEVPIDIVDQDQSSASRDLIFRLDASHAVATAGVFPQAHQAMQHSQTKSSFGYLIIPNDYQRKLIAGEQADVQLFVNQQNFMLGNILSSQVLRQVVESSLRESARVLMVGGDMKEQASAQVMPLKGSRSVLGNSFLNYRTFLLAALLPHIWHVLVITVTVIALGKEFKEGTLTGWLKTSNQNLLIALASKLLVPAIVMALWISAINIWVFVDNNAGGYASLSSLLAVSWLTQLCYHAAGVLIVALTANYRLALSVAAFYTTPAFAFIGVTFPTFSMNGLSKIWLAFLPIGQLIQVQNSILHWQQTLTSLLEPVFFILLYTVSFSIFSFLLLQLKIPQRKFWFQH